MATPFAAACSVAITNNYDTVGTLTRASLKGLTPAQVKALFTDGTQWHEMTSMLRTQFEMAACGVRRYGMYDWIMSSNRPGMGKLVQTVKRDKGPSLIQPFILGRQISVVNDQYWVITGGYATGAYTPGETGPLSTVSGMTRVIRVIAAYGVPLDAKYFLPKQQLFILNLSLGGSALTGQWQVVESAMADDESYVDIGILTLNAFDTSAVDTTPTTGVVLCGINNVHDVEQYCYNRVNVNPVKYVPFWYQTRRRSRRVDSQYVDLFEKLMEDNQWYAQFQDLPLAERNRQDEIADQKQFVNSFFFGRPWSNLQTLTGWTGLPQITSITGATVDPGTGSQLQAYRANMVGVYEQLKACSRVTDQQGQTVNVKTFCETNLYNIWRSRSSQGRPAGEIDIYTNSISADEWMVSFIAYAKAKLGDIVRLNIDEGSNEYGFQWRKFRLFRPLGVTVNIITNEYFDDVLDVFTNLTTGTQAARGRFLAVLDLGKGGSIYPAVLGSNRKVYETGQIEQLAKIDASFSCVMENPTIRTALTSETTTAIVECPLHSEWLENFSTISYS